nr:MAG TPA: hypothetical protein [Caudoviricetes sp.]
MKFKNYGAYLVRLAPLAFFVIYFMVHFYVPIHDLNYQNWAYGTCGHRP